MSQTLEHNNQLLERYRNSITGVFGSPARVLTRGEGINIWDADGNRYMDLLAGIAVNALGHAHPNIVKAVSKQISTLGHISNLFTSEPQIALAEKLLELAHATEGTVFFANSGSEANEAAYKLARGYGNSHGRQKIIALENGFHGRTIGSLALTWKPAYREPFEPMPAGVIHVAAGDIEALNTELDETTAAVIIEPVQGEAGVRNFPGGYLEQVRKACTEAGALMILDEVQSGIGRTGEWFGFQNPKVTGCIEPVVPDVMTLAKGLGGGFPIGAMISFSPEVSAILTAGQHGTTFGGNPVATATGLAVIQTIESENLLENVKTVGAQLASALEAMDAVEAVRAYGLWIGVDLNVSAPDIVQKAMRHGFLINATGESTLRIAPPLIITAGQAEEFTTELAKILKAED